MTTVLADAELGVMVCDSAWSDGTVVGRTRKIFRINHTLVGLAGNLDAFMPFVVWYRDGMGNPMPKMNNLSALVLNEKGLLHFALSAVPFPVLDGWEAIGTGALAAKGAHEAMLRTDPRRAVQIACRHDASSRSPVRMYHLNPKRKR